MFFLRFSILFSVFRFRSYFYLLILIPSNWLLHWTCWMFSVFSLTKKKQSVFILALSYMLYVFHSTQIILRIPLFVLWVVMILFQWFVHDDCHIFVQCLIKLFHQIISLAQKIILQYQGIIIYLSNYWFWYTGNFWKVDFILIFIQINSTILIHLLMVLSYLSNIRNILIRINLVEMNYF